MQLKKLLVSGFKSFVDQTDIRLPSKLVAVVGPNGCGKSNVIDAVRWVMGESSAKMLRGDSMADVIFNGSSARKPVGKASVELLFDNADGSAGGNFAPFSEISVKRTLSRDGQSDYFINRVKTRRKDVLDLFRGTGLGPRSYSIIEQGMVSRIVEARPDDLRAFVEEAAGTSKYKDRRRETETRIRHTRENLERVADIRDELDKHLRRLKRQASSARRYKVLKEEERLVAGQFEMLRLRAMEEQLSDQDRLTAKYENSLESALASQREIETETEKLRQQQSDSQDQYNRVQQEFYSLGAEIKNSEQRIEHLIETRQRQGEEIERLQLNREERGQQIGTDRDRMSRLNAELAELEPEIQELEQQRQQADERLSNAEIELENWQSNWDLFNEQSQAPARQQEVQQSRISQLEQHLKRSTDQKSRLEQDLASAQKLTEAMDIDALRLEVQRHDDNCERSEQAFRHTENEIQSTQQALQQKRDEAAGNRAQQHETQSRQESLKEIQSAALGGDNEALQSWLAQSGIGHLPRLASRIRVSDGWERAADRLMNGFLGAVCVDQLPDGVLVHQPDSAFTLVTGAVVDSKPDNTERPRLIDKVSAGDTDLSAFLGGVYTAVSLPQAVSMQSALSSRECVVTRDGTLVGANWVSFASQSQMETGVLVREEEIQQLANTLQEFEQVGTAIDRQVGELNARREALQQKLQQQRSELNQLRADKTEKHSKLSREEARHLEAEQRIVGLHEEIKNLVTLVENDHREISQARQLLQHAADQKGTLASKRDDMLEQKDRIQRDLARRKDEMREINDSFHDCALQKQRLDAELESTADGIARLEEQFQATKDRLAQINHSLVQSGDPITDLKARLESMLERRIGVERRFSEASDYNTDLDNRIIQINERRSAQLNAVNDAREVLNQHKLSKQEILVRRDTLKEQISNQGYDQQLLASEMPEDANVAQWQSNLEDLERKINRIGPVNLVAIEEFDEESERKEYLDRQHADLTEALDTLQSVIRKIDRETRARFRETFDQINIGFNMFFPKLFGGGKAELQLTSDDLLTAGVSVMARPPGKRNSHIHLLSGGEKALTAVALLFSLFKLNPAPFCMLDEVDAPLDDANVDRYCRTLKTLSEVSQMIVITHNKITMEAADVLVGVTMAEPGVSRLVSVDIDEAVEMAAL